MVQVEESVDPIILSMKLVDVCECRPCDCCCEIPPSICACFPEELVMGGDVHRLYVTLGQFSIIRMERDTQLLIPAYDYCLPEKECACQGAECGEDPCETVAAVTLSRPELDDAFCQTLAAALTETEAGEQFLAACRPDAVFASASEEALQAVRDYAADLEAQEHGGAA